jgi:hypothetical protein
MSEFGCCKKVIERNNKSNLLFSSRIAEDTPLVRCNLILVKFQTWANVTQLFLKTKGNYKAKG